MRVFKSDEICTALQYGRACAREGKPFILSKCGMNYQTAKRFVDAVTHSFFKDKHGFDLDQIFKIGANGNWIEQEFCPRNPKDATVVVRIKQAMAYVSKNQREVKQRNDSVFVSHEETEVSEEELIKHIEFINKYGQKYGYMVFKKV